MDFSYAWRDDVVEIEDRLDITDEGREDIRYILAEKIVADNGEDDVYSSHDAAVAEEAQSIIHIWCFKKDSLLALLLENWFEGDIIPKLRYGYEDEEYYYFVSGCNYAIFDADLLGGNGNRDAELKFDVFVDNKIEQFKEAC